MKFWIGRVAIACGSLLVAVWFTVFIITHTVFHSYHVPTLAMEPTIHAGDFILARRLREIRRGDIITFEYPFDRKTMFIKRVVGMPGEKIEIREKHVFVNGAELKEPYAAHVDPQVYPRQPALPEPYRSRDWFGPYDVPADSYFALGDNRDRSSDSRYWGSVARPLVKGIVVWRIGKDGFRRIGQ